MVFISRKGEPVDMWMSTVSYPLDMIWLGGDGRVVKILSGVRPGDRKTYPGPRSAIACVELLGGTCRAAGIGNGAPWTLRRC
jgi:uncharacterized membrane protein (UPF0127 family)